MTKYSSETKKDEDEPEEGEIQDDDDDYSVDDKLQEEENSTFLKGKESEKYSKHCFLFPRDEPKSQRKSDHSTYGGKSYYLPEETDDQFTCSQGSSRARFRTSGVNKWYYQHRQNNASKDWSSWKPSGVSKERERKSRETKRTSRSQYYSSFFHSRCESRSSVSVSLPSNTYFSPSIPAWHWYSKRIKEKNKKTSLAKYTDVIGQITANGASNSENFESHPNAMENANKECHKKKEIEKQADAGLGSPTSLNSIEIIEVPPKIPEVITLYDTDEEEQNKNSNKITTNFSNNEVNAQNNEQTQKAITSHFYVGSNCQPDISQENNIIKKNQDMQFHLKELTSAMRNMFDERKQQELRSRQNDNATKSNVRIVNTSDLSVHGENENNMVTSKVDTCLAIPVSGNLEINFPSDEIISENDAFSSQTDLDSNLQKDSMNIQNTIVPNVSVSKSLTNKSEVFENRVHLIPTASCSSTLSPFHISYQTPSEHGSENEFSSIFIPNALYQPLVKICSSNASELENWKENEKSPIPFISDHTNENYTFSSVEMYNTFQEDCCSGNNQYLHSENSNTILADESTKDVIPLNGSINSIDLDSKKSITENTNMNKKYIGIYGNEEAENTDSIQDSTSIIEALCSLRGNEHCNVKNVNIPDEVFDDMKSKENPMEVSNIHIHMENIVQIECTETVKTDKINCLLQNIVPTVGNSDESANLLQNRIESEIPNADNTVQHNCTDFSASRDKTSIIQTCQSKMDEECNLRLNEKMNNEGKNSSEKVGRVENVLWNNCNISEPIREVEASTVAALKRRATELKKLEKCDSTIKSSLKIKKCENQGLIPRVIINKQLKDSSQRVSSEYYTPVYSSSLHLNNENKKLKKPMAPSISQINSLGNNVNAVSDKYFAYPNPALVYEDRIGSKKSNEAGNLREQMAKRINVTVPEFIINLGKESDSGDDSEDESTISPSKRDENSNFVITQSINTDFEKKLDVLLKQARSQQELNSVDSNGSFIVNDQLILSSVQSNNENNCMGPESSLIHHKDVHSLNVDNCSARIMPRTVGNKMSCSRVEKIKVVSQKMKSVVIKNTSSNLHHAKTIHPDRASKHSTSAFNYSKQASRGLNKTLTNKEKNFPPRSSMADIRLLSPLKQKEYLKLKKQLVQMTQKKRERQTEGKSECTCDTNKDNKPECEKFKQIPVIIGSEGNNKQKEGHQFTASDERINNVHKTLLQNPEKTAEHDSHHTNSETTSENIMSECINKVNTDHSHQQGYLQEMSLYQTCSKVHVPEVNIIDSENNVLSHVVIPPDHQKINIIESSAGSLTSNLSSESAFQQHKCSIEFEREIKTNNGSQETANCSSEKILSKKRKLQTLDQEQKKQKTDDRENGKQIRKMKDTATKATMCSVIHSKVLDDLWSTETKLIVRRRQVLEDIATVRLNSHKMDATNFRIKQIKRRICHLKEELKQAEGELNQEIQYSNDLQNIIGDSKHSMQRGQSELLSLSLECEELGCKVHGPNYSVPSTCVDLIRTEMLAMTEAMQELENKTNAT